MRHPDSDLKALIADLRLAGYSDSDIARAVERSRQRVRQLLCDMGLKRPTAKTVEDFPPHLRERILAFRNCQNAM